MEIIYTISWIIVAPVSILGVVVLLKSVKISSYVLKLLPIKTRENLDLFIKIFKPGTKKELFLFSWGLGYLENRDTKIIYFYCSIIATVLSFRFLLTDKTPLTLGLLIISSFILFLNIVFYNVGKHLLKRFKN
jgi:hypothetical protein